MLINGQPFQLFKFLCLSLKITNYLDELCLFSFQTCSLTNYQLSNASRYPPSPSPLINTDVISQHPTPPPLINTDVISQHPPPPLPLSTQMLSLNIPPPPLPLSTQMLSLNIPPPLSPYKHRCYLSTSHPPSPLINTDVISQHPTPPLPL